MSKNNKIAAAISAACLVGGSAFVAWRFLGKKKKPSDDDKKKIASFAASQITFRIMSDMSGANTITVRIDDIGGDAILDPDVLQLIADDIKKRGWSVSFDEPTRSLIVRHDSNTTKQ